MNHAQFSSSGLTSGGIEAMLMSNWGFCSPRSRFCRIASIVNSYWFSVFFW